MKKCALITRKRKKFKKTELIASKRRGCQQSTVDGREAEITVDLLLQARAKMSDNKVNGPEDAVVSEMIKQLPLEKISTNHEVLPRTLQGPDGGAKFIEDCETDLLEEKPHAEPKKRTRSYRAIALTSVFSKRPAFVLLFRLEQEMEP